MFKLDPFLEDTLLRVGGRIKFGNWHTVQNTRCWFSKLVLLQLSLLRCALFTLGYVGRQHVLAISDLTIGSSMPLLLFVKFCQNVPFAAKNSNKRRVKNDRLTRTEVDS